LKDNPNLGSGWTKTFFLPRGWSLRIQTTEGLSRSRLVPSFSRRAW